MQVVQAEKNQGEVDLLLVVQLVLQEDHWEVEMVDLKVAVLVVDQEEPYLVEVEVHQGLAVRVEDDWVAFLEVQEEMEGNLEEVPVKVSFDDDLDQLALAFVELQVEVEVHLGACPEFHP